jgi:hypothetical protein
METKLAEASSEAIREEVRRRYGATARGESSSCGDECCTSTSAETLGYSTEQSAIAPEAANLGLGCGNPVAIASLQPGRQFLIWVPVLASTVFLQRERSARVGWLSAST